MVRTRAVLSGVSRAAFRAAIRFALAVLLAGVARHGMAEPIGDKVVVLVADWGMRDSEYRETVLVTARLPPPRRITIILNRQTRRSLASLLPPGEAPKAVVENAFYGGSATGPLVAIMQSGEDPLPGSLQLAPNVYLVYRSSSFNRLIETAPNSARYYVGYLAWPGNLLDLEIERGRWLVLNATADILLRKDTGRMWEELIEIAYERAHGPGHPRLAALLSNLAFSYQKEGRYALAEPRYRRALLIYETAEKPDPAKVALTLNNLGTLYHEQNRNGEAEPLLVRALAIIEKLPDAEPWEVANNLMNLANVYKAQGRDTEAASLLERSRRLGYDK